MSFLHMPEHGECMSDSNDFQVGCADGPCEVVTMVPQLHFKTLFDGKLSKTKALTDEI